MTQLEEAVLNKFRDFRVAFEALCDSRYGTIPTASTTQKGGIIVGGGLSMVGDTLTVTLSGGTDNDADIAELDGKIATLNDSITALDVNLNTALTKLDQLDSGTTFSDTSEIDELKSDIVLIESRLDDFAYQLDNVTANVESSGEYTLPTASTVTKGGVVIGGGLSMVGDTLTVTLQGGSGGLSSAIVERVNEMFAPEPALQERYATSPFDSANIVGLDLSHLVDGSNFEYETLEGGEVRIRSGETSYNVNNGISRGYVEVKTLCGCTVTVLYSISSQASYDYGGCIITEDAPNTEFTLADLKSSTVNKFFYKSGKLLNQTATYRLEKNKTYYLNFGYAKNASTNTNDDRFYIHEIRITPEFSSSSRADYFFDAASDIVNFAQDIATIVGGVDNLDSVYFADNLNAVKAKIINFTDFAQNVADAMGCTYEPTSNGLDTVKTKITTFKNTVISGVGSKFRPSATTVDDIINGKNNFNLMAHKYSLVYRKALAPIQSESANTFLGGETTLSFADAGANHSLCSSLNDSYVTLASDTSSSIYAYGVCKLTETAGFLTQQIAPANLGLSYTLKRNVIPFNVASSGTVSLGATVTIHSASSSVLATTWKMFPAIYDPCHIMFTINANVDNEDHIHSYAAISFNVQTRINRRVDGEVFSLR